MLKDNPWIRLAPDLAIEWRQCCDEGLDVAAYEALCKTQPPLSEEAAEAVAAMLHAQPVRADYPYIEPSTYDEIVAERPQGPAFDRPAATGEALRDKIKGAWYGRIAGCLLGKPVEGMRRDRLLPLLRETDNYPMRGYIRQAAFTDALVERLQLYRGACWADTVTGISPADDDTNYTVLALKIVEERGRDFTADDVMEMWLRNLPLLPTCTAERAAYRNAAAGMEPPQTALHKNPYREWIGAQIRADFYGYMYPGDPERAAACAFRDASISHVKNGIYGAMYVAAMIAAAAACDSVDEVIAAGLTQIPARSRLRRDMDAVLAWHAEGLAPEAIIEKIHETYDEHDQHDWCLTNSNAMIVTMALLGGEGDFSRTVGLAVQAAFDTDCNGATVGSIFGMLYGAGAIGTEWTAPFREGLETAIAGNNRVVIDDLIARTLRLIKA